MNRNKLIIASAGAGKTTYLVEKALTLINENKDATVLITTYTRSNAEQIRIKVKEENFKRGGPFAIPKNLVVQEWFTFLLSEGIRPFKSLMDERLKYKSIRLLPDFQFSANKFKPESNVLGHYFVNYKIVPNSLSKFVHKANDKSRNELTNRLSNIYSYVFIDEVQDLAGYDLEIIHELIKSPINILLVGDPRQVTYLTHQPQLNKQYKNGKIENYISEKCEKLNIIIDQSILKKSHRNNNFICDFSSKLYPHFEKSIPCECIECRVKKEDTGIFVIQKSDIENCQIKFKDEKIGILRWQKSISPEKNYGDSKGLTYDRVIIYPTEPIIKYLKNGKLKKEVKNKKGEIITKDSFDIAKFYVAITRAKHSVFIVCDFKDKDSFIEGVQKYMS